MYIYIYMYMYIYIYIYIYICIYLHMYIHISINAHVYIYIYLYLFVCVFSNYRFHVLELYQICTTNVLHVACLDLMASYVLPFAHTNMCYGGYGNLWHLTLHGTVIFLLCLFMLKCNLLYCVTTRNFVLACTSYYLISPHLVLYRVTS